MHKKGKKNLIIRNSTAEFLIFSSQAKSKGIEVRYEDENLWLTQKMMGELFSVTKQTISEHLKNVFESRELIEDSVVRNFLTTAADGKNYNTQFYGLDAVISVRSDLANVAFTRRLQIFTPQVLITILNRKQPKNFSLKFKIKCTMRFTAKLPQKLLLTVQLLKNNTWA